MSMRSLLLFLNVLQVSLFHLCHGDEWDYGRVRGPSHWCHLYTGCCGDQQSPINVDTAAAEPQNFPSLVFHGYKDLPTQMNLKNNGHTLHVDVSYQNVLPSISAGGLGDNYTLNSFHFHWGSDDEQGSEHTLNGMQYPLELHLVHMNTKYKHLRAAIENPDGLAVLGILYTVSEDDNLWMNDIVNSMGDVTYHKDAVNLTRVNFTLMDLLPRWTDHFYRYLGSLTTPGCGEIVTWTVFSAKQTISRRQLNVFRKLRSTDRDEIEVMMADNYRPVQKLKGRKVFQSQPSASPKISNQSMLLSFLVFLIPLLFL